LRDKLFDKEFKNRYKKYDNVFVRDRILTFEKVLLITMQNRTTSLQNTINNTLKEIYGIDSKELVSVSTSAYTQARRNFKAEAFLELSNDVVNMIYTQADIRRFKNYRLLGIDGSIIQLPNELKSDLKNYFNETINRCQIDGFEKRTLQARASILYDLQNEIVIDCYLKNGVKSKDENKKDIRVYSERDLALMHLNYCNKDDIVMMDRGYPSYEIFEAFMQKTNFVIRCKINSFKEIKPLFDKDNKQNDIIVELKAPQSLIKQNSNIQKSIKVRFVKVILDNGEIEVLATNILDNNTISTNEFKKLYAKRWNIETLYDLIKNRLQLENFTGYSYDAIMQDFYVTMFFTNLETMYTFDVKRALEKKQKIDNTKYNQKVNKAVSFNALKSFCVGIFFLDDTQIDKDQMFENLQRIFYKNRIVIRPQKSKNKTRKKKEKTKTIRDSLKFYKRKKKYAV